MCRSPTRSSARATRPGRSAKRPASWPMRTTSATVNGKASREDCGSTPRRAASAAALPGPIGISSRRSDPCAAISPVSARSSVVLPEPLGPTMAVTAPGAAVKSTPCRMAVPPISTCRSRACSISEIHQPAPPQQDPQENRRAEHRGDDADGQLCGRDDHPGDDVGPQQQARPEQRAVDQQGP